MSQLRAHVVYFVGAIRTVLVHVTQLAHSQTQRLVRTHELALSTVEALHLVLVPTDALVRPVRTVGASVASGRDGGTRLVRAAELLRRASVVDVRGWQDGTVLLVVSHRTVYVHVADLVPLQTFAPVFTQVSPTQVSRAPQSLVFSVHTVVLAVTQLPLVDTVHRSIVCRTLKLLLATVGSRERLHRFAEFSLVFSMATVPDLVTNTTK